MSSAQTTIRATWLTAFLLVSLTHLAIWQWYQDSPLPIKPAVAPTLVEVSLETLTAPIQTSQTASTTTSQTAPATTPPQQSTQIPETAQSAPAAFAPAPAITTATEPGITPPTPAPTQVTKTPEPPAPIQPVAATPPSITAKPTVEPVLVPARYYGPGLSNPKASYPLMAKKRGLEGTVVLKAEILPDGRCGQISIKKTSGYDILDQAALQAVTKWHFTPAKRGEQAIAGWVDIPIEFKLTD